MGSLTLQNISKSFNTVEIFKGIDLEVKDGEFVVFIGPSGCGKSTLLRIIAGLEHASQGDVLIDGMKVNHIPPSQRGIAMVFQSYALYPHLSVKNNMGLGLKQANYSAPEINERVSKASRMLFLDTLLERQPAELSGGQRQRVAIGRAIVREPELFLFDEPLSNLDATLRINTRLEIAQLHRDLKTTMIYVTHDQTEAMTLADKIVILNEGKIQQIGSPMDLYNNPANQFVAGFIGTPQMNFIGAQALGYDRQGTIGIRPEHCLLSKKDTPLKGVVSHVENLGADTNVYLQCENKGLVTVRLFGAHKIEIGSTHAIAYDENQAFHFDAKGVRL